MVPEIGHILLLLANAIAICLLVLSLSQLVYNFLEEGIYYKISKYSFNISFTAISLSFTILIIAFINNDYTVAYVWHNSHNDLPLIYRITAVWGGHEGSWFLWLILLSFYICIFFNTMKESFFKKSPHITFVTSFILVGFLSFLIFTSNPFLRILPIAPANGQDLNPLLQDPAFTIHPPWLYLGYVALAIPYIMTIQVLFNTDLFYSKDVLKKIRIWTLWSWIWLTAGIAMGSWWAYKELGWGGWWFWDPVENSSLMPWITSTALLHACMLKKGKRSRFWVYLLSISSFILSLLGTFLVRSGIIISVHSFAVDPNRGLYLLSFFVIKLMVASFFLTNLWIKIENIEEKKNTNNNVGHWLYVQNILLYVMMLIILLGTIYPIIAEVIWSEKISVGKGYFEQVLAPFVIVFSYVIGMSVIDLKWLESKFRNIVYTIVGVLLAIILALFFTNLFNKDLEYTFIIGMMCFIWMTFTHILLIFKKGLKKKYPVIIAHSAVIIIAFSVFVNASYEKTKIVSIDKGECVYFFGYNYCFENIYNYKKDNYISQKATIVVSNKNKLNHNSKVKSYFLLEPSIRYYPSRSISQTKVAIKSFWWADLYVAISKVSENSSYIMRIYIKPLQIWLWAGACMLVFSGFLAWLRMLKKGIKNS